MIEGQERRTWPKYQSRYRHQELSIGEILAIGERAGVLETNLDIRRNGRKEELVAEEDGEVVMGDVLRLKLLIVVGSKVLGGMTFAVKGSALNGSVLEDTGCH